MGLCAVRNSGNRVDKIPRDRCHFPIHQETTVAMAEAVLSSLSPRGRLPALEIQN